jgi:hypothetical protein
MRSEEEVMATRKKAKKTKKRAKAKAKARSTTRRGSTRSIARSGPVLLQMDDFYADELTLQRNAQNADERRRTRDAAMIVWRLDDVGSIQRHEADVKWGWALRRY